MYNQCEITQKLGKFNGFESKSNNVINSIYDYIYEHTTLTYIYILFAQNV